jgi:hypothetical protein
MFALSGPGTARAGRRRPLVLLAAVLAVVVLLPDCGSSATPSTARAWLGLNDNARRGLGKLAEFADRGIAYDHDIDIVAGETPSSDGCRDWVPGWPANHFFDARDRRGVFDRLLHAGMIPVVTIAYCGAGDDFDHCHTHLGLAGGQTPFLTQCLPTDANSPPYDINSYVTGFITTANAIRQYVSSHAPGRRVVFEPINEPWGYGSPGESERATAADYARIIARLLPAAQRAGIPLRDVYVGANQDRAGWVGLMYAAQPSLAYLVGGWYFHPYGLPADTLNGIEGVAVLRNQYARLSGWNNVIVSELGYCVTPRPRGGGVGPPRSDVCSLNLHEVDTRWSFQAGQWLTEALDEALPMHQDGWLRALIVWDRTYSQAQRGRSRTTADDGWAMQLPDGRLTAQGRALEAFAASAGGLPTASPDLTRDPLTGRQLLAYVGADGAIRRSTYAGSPLRWTGSTQLGGESIAPDTSPAELPMAASAGIGQEAIVYSGVHGQLWSWVRYGRRWYRRRLGGGVAAASSPAATTDPHGAKALVTYVGRDRSLWQASWNRSRRRWSNTRLGGERAARNSSPSSGELGTARPPIMYVGANRQIWAWSWSGGRWRNRDLGGEAAASTSPSVTGEGSASVWGTYVGADASVWQLFWNRRTGTITHTRLGGEPAAPDSSPSESELPSGRGPIFYVGADGEVWFWSWTGTRWQNGRVGGQAAAGSSPIAIQDPSTGDIWVGFTGVDGTIHELRWSSATANWADVVIAGPAA